MRLRTGSGGPRPGQRRRHRQRGGKPGRGEAEAETPPGRLGETRAAIDPRREADQHKAEQREKAVAGAICCSSTQISQATVA